MNIIPDPNYSPDILPVRWIVTDTETYTSNGTIYTIVDTAVIPDDKPTILETLDL